VWRREEETRRGGAGRGEEEPRRGGSGKEGGGAAPPPVAAPLPGRETFCEPRLLVGNGSSEQVRKEKGTKGYHCLFM